MKITLIIALVLIAANLWFRFSPTDVGKFHNKLNYNENHDFEGGAVRIIEGDETTLARLDQIAMSTPRTKAVAGDIKDGLITYESRSAFWGFPDYTTVQATEGQIMIYGRLRFGRKDFGVNRARIENWVSQL